MKREVLEFLKGMAHGPDLPETIDWKYQAPKPAPPPLPDVVIDERCNDAAALFAEAAVRWGDKESRLVSSCCWDDVRLGKIGEFWCEACGGPLVHPTPGMVPRAPEVVILGYPLHERDGTTRELMKAATPTHLDLRAG